MMEMYASASAPVGWLVCNGSAVSRTTYAALFAVIGTTFGIGDGSTTFNLPDMRGYFPRGFDAGAGRDPGRVFGSTQTDQMQGHIHRNGVGQTNGSPTMMTYTTTATDVPGNGLNTAHADNNTAQSQGTTSVPISDGTNGTPRTGTETRPLNVALDPPWLDLSKEDCPLIRPTLSERLRAGSRSRPSGRWHPNPSLRAPSSTTGRLALRSGCVTPMRRMTPAMRAVMSRPRWRLGAGRQSIRRDQSTMR